jgi:hypothetical protein
MFVVGALQSWPSFAALITETGSSVVYIRKNAPICRKSKETRLAGRSVRIYDENSLRTNAAAESFTASSLF